MAEHADAQAFAVPPRGLFGGSSGERGDGGAFGVFAPRRAAAAIGRGVAGAGIDQLVATVMSADLIATVVLQRIFIGYYITLGTHLIAFAVLLLRGRLRISGVRVALCWLFWGGAVVLQLVSGHSFSTLSMLLVLACYVSFIGVVPASQATYFAVLGTFQKLALAVAGLVFVDIVVQLAGLGIPNMNLVVPPGMVTQSMNYLQPITWGSPIQKPNAFFMLEASTTSQFLSMGLIFEVSFFKRWRWLVALSLGLLLTFSGTGLMLLLLCLPALLRRVWRTVLIYAIVLVPLLAGIAVATGWYAIAETRMGSFNTRNSSANERFVVPYVTIMDIATSGNVPAIVFGFGAGKTAEDQYVPGVDISEYNPVSKVFIEYGFFVTFFFLVFTSYCFFTSGAPFIVAYAALLEYHVMGGNLLLPPIVNYCYILAAGWALRPRSEQPLGGLASRSVPLDAGYQ
jgi:hypothetical protein